MRVATKGLLFSGLVLVLSGTAFAQGAGYKWWCRWCRPGRHRNGNAECQRSHGVTIGRVWRKYHEQVGRHLAEADEAEDTEEGRNGGTGLRQWWHEEGLLTLMLLQKQ